MKLHIVARRRAQKEEWNLHGEGRASNREQRHPPQSRAGPSGSARFAQRRFSRTGLSQTRSPCRAKLNASETQSTFNPVLFNPDSFNPDLTLLKSSCNGLRLPCLHWGGTDCQESRGSCQRRARVPRFFARPPQASRSHAFFIRRTARLKSLPKDHLPRTCRGRPLNGTGREARQTCDRPRGPVIVESRFVRWKSRRVFLPGCADAAVQKGSRPVAATCPAAITPAADLPVRRPTLPPSFPPVQIG